ncbi:Zinc finger, RING-type [Corchorus olitorius]|uniref:E3 ubiquitin-protein ligase RMA n=1 Tax=Corchorus olitorius TaxID=93759 RepID=A0A1R3KC88_9ROSI|nr:Zinc finger, RING-type [Corchorus olitorius]
MESTFYEPEAHFASDGDVSLKQKWNQISGPTREPEQDAGGFDCNICFESAQDPVVTLCGHLYCWPCIYKWLNVQTSSLDADERHQNCPVCKANISSSSLVPLYGRGTSSCSDSKNHHSDMDIPQRPPPSGLNTIITSPHPSQRLNENFFHSQSQSFHHQYFPQPYGGYATLASSNLGGIAMTNFFNPMIGMFGEMVYARIFGDTSLFTYPYQASHPFFSSNNVRMRRQEMQVDKSLSRVSIFLLCCIILCLLLF